MSVRRLLLVALAAALVVGIFTPTATSDHCRTKLTAYGRVSSAPLASPPYTSATAGMCLAAYKWGADDHVLPPETDQVLARVNGDFGSAYPTILIELTGLGFEAHTFPAIRQASPYGGTFYQLSQWVTLPAGPASGDLVVKAYYPAGPVTATYRVLALPDAPTP